MASHEENSNIKHRVNVAIERIMRPRVRGDIDKISESLMAVIRGRISVNIMVVLLML